MSDEAMKAAMNRLWGPVARQRFPEDTAILCKGFEAGWKAHESEALAALRELVYGVKNHGFGGDTTFQKARANAESFLSNQEKP